MLRHKISVKSPLLSTCQSFTSKSNMFDVSILSFVCLRDSRAEGRRIDHIYLESEGAGGRLDKFGHVGHMVKKFDQKIGAHNS